MPSGYDRHLKYPLPVDHVEDGVRLVQLRLRWCIRKTMRMSGGSTPVQPSLPSPYPEWRDGLVPPVIELAKLH